MAFYHHHYLFFFAFVSISLPISIAQTAAPAPVSDVCNGIFLSYEYIKGSRLPPVVSDPSNQPYKFESTLTILNNGLEDLKSWNIFVGFQHNELLVSASNAVLANGTTLPTRVGNGITFAGFPTTDLKTAVETAGDETQMQVQIQLVGTQFGVNITNTIDVPMPSNISLVNEGYTCPKPTNQGKRKMYACCNKDPNFVSNVTKEEFLPRRSGDLTITYDVVSAYDTDYWAQVTITNNNPLGRLDNWKLKWQWTGDEFIAAMKGAYPSVVDTTDCIYGRQGVFYKGLDFSTVLNCEKTPTIIDLPPTKANDSKVGLIPFCCRNGTILPASMDPSKSVSVFQIHVYKMPPYLNRTKLVPPQYWNISGTLNPDYQCEPPIRVSPSLFPDPSGLPSSSSAIASWQVVCNIIQPKEKEQRSPSGCCVSFSAFNNDSVIPCPTCACCQSNNPSNTCNATAPALLLPSEALLVPFENRTKLALAWANLKHLTVPNPLPCGDNCGVSINWHLYTDYRNGWSARITLFNWDQTNFADWFAAVQFGKAAPGFEAMYSFNASMVVVDGVNNTIFMQGFPGFNYLVAEKEGANPRTDPRVPGKLQSIISFTKMNTPGINVAGGDGFPTKVFFNGEECSLPTVLPTSIGHKMVASKSILSFLLSIVALMLMQL
ncbi:PREDICTED: COBRA-like protein 7 [Nelumbo nucifera]|uniref:COBRA-like protein 7 n=1 Tax=Nelumbo nucifera TaxID=4432 RepID=A0A1U8AXN2_NELNU|nr:PREDICTED: COBRA-like protein 7 [Nelumbo nucifera]